MLNLCDMGPCAMAKSTKCLGVIVQRVRLGPCKVSGEPKSTIGFTLQRFHDSMGRDFLPM